MVIKDSKKLISQRRFVIDAPQQRVWNLLARAIYNCLPLEKIDIVNERLFFAELRWKLALVSPRFHLKGEFVDISSPSVLSCMISVNKGIIHLGLMITFTLRPSNQDKTEIVCHAMEADKRKMLMSWVIKIPQQNFAGKIFDSIRARLEQIC